MNSTPKSAQTALLIFLMAACQSGCIQSSESFNHKPVQEPAITQPAQETIDINHTSYNPPLKLYVINNSVNVRSGPGKEHAVIASRKKGQLFKAYGKNDDWYYTKLENGHKGYVHSQLLNDVKPRITPTKPVAVSSDTAAKTTPAEKPAPADAPAHTNSVPPPPEPLSTPDRTGQDIPQTSPEEPPVTRQPTIYADQAQPALPEATVSGEATDTAPMQSAPVEEPIVSVPLREPPEEFSYIITIKTYQDRAGAEQAALSFMAKGHTMFIMPVKMLNGAVGYNLNFDSIFSKEEEAYRSALAFSKRENVALAIFQVKGNYHFKIRQITAD